MGILLTLGVMYSVFEDIKTNKIFYYFLSLFLLLLAVTNHLWEASIALPAAVAYYQAGKIRRAAGIIATTSIVITVVEVIKSFQPSSSAHIRTDSVFYHPDALMTPDWIFHWAWGGDLVPSDLFAISIIWTIPIAVVLMLLISI